MAPEKVETIERMRAAGKSYRQIAAKIGMSPGAVSWYCLRYAIESSRDRAPSAVTPGAVERRGNHVVRRFTPEEDAQILEMEGRGTPVYRIAQALGRANSSIIGRLMTLAARDESKART